MFETLVNSAWQSLTPSIGGIALACVGVGIAIGVIRKLIDQFGNIKVLIGIGAIVVVAWAVRYVTAPPRVEVREVLKPVVVEKLVVDTRSVDAMKWQLEAMQKEKESLANMVNEARAGASKAEAEIESRDNESPGQGRSRECRPYRVHRLVQAGERASPLDRRADGGTETGPEVHHLPA